MPSRAVRSRAARRRTTLALLAAAALAVGACGGSRSSSLTTSSGAGAGARTPEAPPLQALQAAATRTASTSTARLSLSVTADFSGLPDTGSQSLSGKFTIKAAGALDLGSKRARIDLDLSQLPADQRPGLPGGHVVVLIDGKTVYAQAAGLGIRSDKPWIRLDGAGAGGGLDLSQFAQDGPTQGLQLLDQLGQAVVVGNEQLRGAATTHYRGSLDLGKALTALGSGGTAGLSGSGAAAEALPGLASVSVPVDAWIDGDGRVRKVQTTVDLMPFFRALFGALGGLGGQSNASQQQLPANAKAEFTMSFELYDFGAGVDVAPPPADQVGPPPPGFTMPGSSSGSSSRSSSSSFFG